MTRACVPTHHPLDYGSGEPRISVVVTILSTAGHLKQCLDSLLDQDLCDIEVICVNDASPGDAAAILERYQSADPRIRVLEHTVKLGLAAARNTGVDNARGQYVRHLNSDDFLPEDALSRLYDIALRNNSDIVRAGGQIYREEVLEPMQHYQQPYSGDTELTRYADCESLWSFSECGFYLFRRTFLIEQQLEFLEGVHEHEDYIFLSNALPRAQRVSLLDKSCCYYRPISGKRTLAMDRERAYSALLIKANLEPYPQQLSYHFNRMRRLYYNLLNRAQKRYTAAQFLTLRAQFREIYRDVDLSTPSPPDIESYFQELVQPRVVTRPASSPSTPAPATRFRTLTASAPPRPLISVIVPVFNAHEPFLRQCLGSALRQTYSNVELIAVNDCATDGSPAILNEYQSKDARLRVAHHAESLGLPAARNTGLSRARGQYVFFLDSDDWLRNDCLNTLHAMIDADRSDIALGAMASIDWYSGRADDRIIGENFLGAAPRTTTLQRYPTLLFNHHVQNKLYRRAFLVDTDIRFKEQSRLGQDVLFSLAANFHASAISLTSEVTYHRRVGNAAQDTTALAIQDAVTHAIEAVEFVESHGTDDMRAISRLMALRGHLLAQADGLLPDEEVVAHLQRYSRVVRHSHTETRLLDDSCSGRIAKALLDGDFRCALQEWRRENAKPILAVAEPFVSVVVPVHGTEKFLDECLDSLCQQTLREIEIIIVDDASPGPCASIVKRRMQCDRRIKLTRHARNKGTLQARLSGARVATGEFLFTMDPDDYLDHGLLRQMYKTAYLSRADIVDVGFTSHDQNTGKTEPDALSAPPYRHCNSSGELLTRFLSCSSKRSVCGKLVHRGRWQSALVDPEMDRYLIYGESPFLSFYLLATCTLYVSVSNPGYFFRLHDEAISTRGTIEAVRSAIDGYSIVVRSMRKQTAGRSADGRVGARISSFKQFYATEVFEKQLVKVKKAVDRAMLMDYGACTLGDGFSEAMVQRLARAQRRWRDLRREKRKTTEAMTRRIDRLKSSVEELRTKHESAISCVKNLNALIGDLRSELTALGVERDSLHEDQKVLRARHTALEQELSVLEADLSRTVAHARRLKAKLDYRSKLLGGRLDDAIGRVKRRLLAKST